jgi:hypothetical protein
MRSTQDALNQDALNKLEAAVVDLVILVILVITIGLIPSRRCGYQHRQD